MINKFFNISNNNGGIEMVPGLRKSRIARIGVVFSLVISLSSVVRAAVAPVVTVLEPVESVLSTPLKTALDANGDMYVADPRAGGVVVLDQYGVLKQVVKTDKSAGGVALMGLNAYGGKLLVGQGDTVAVYDQAGVKVTQLGSFGNVAALAVDAAGAMYVADVTSHSVKKLDSTGVQVAEFGAATLTQPVSVAIVNTTAGQQVAVLDCMARNVQFFTLAGAPVKTVSNVSAGDFGYPSGVAFEYANGALSRMYVVDMYQGQIKVIDAVTDQFLSNVGNYGLARGALLTPSDVAFDQVNGRLLVANGLSNLVSYGVDGGKNPVNATPPALQMPQDVTVSVSSVLLSGSVDAGCTIAGAADTSAAVHTASFSGTTSWAIAVDGLVPGKNNISVTAKNQYGTAITKSVVVSYLPPAILLTADAIPSLTGQPLLAMTGSVESGAVVKVFNAALGQSSDASVIDGKWYLAQSLVEGANALKVTATKPGTVATSIDLQIVLDTKPPVITASMLPDGSTSASQVLNVAGVVYEPNLAALTVNGQAVVPVNGYFDTVVSLVNGPNVITIKAVDALGNVSTDVRTINYVPGLPVVTLQSPVDGSYTNQQDIVVVGSLDKQASVKVNGGAVSVDASLSWSAPIKLVNGVNTIIIEVTDPYGQVATVKRTVTYDNTAPVVKIVSPSVDYATKSPSFNINGTVSDDTPIKGITAQVNGKDVPVAFANGEFNVFQAMDVEGAYSVAVSVVDSASNITTVQRTVLYDITPPVLTVDPVMSSYPQAISGTVEVGANVVVKDANGVTAAVKITGQSWTADLSNITYDKNTLSITATDAAGNATVVGLTVVAPDGDLDGDGVVTVKDALIALKLAVSGQVPTAQQLAHGDIGPLLNGKANPNGKIDVVDGILILRKALGLSSW